MIGIFFCKTMGVPVIVDTPDDGIAVGLLSEGSRDSENNLIVPFEGNSIIDRLLFKQHYHYEPGNVCNNEYVFKEDQEGDGLISLVNTTDKPISDVEVNFILRDHQYVWGDGTSQRRDKAIEFEDKPQRRRLDWDNATMMWSNRLVPPS